MPDLKPPEIEDVKKGKIQIGFLMHKEIIFLVAKLGCLDWINAPYHVRLSPKYTLQPCENENKGYSLTVCLVESNNGIIKALRLVTMPYKLSKTFNEYVTRQKFNSRNDFNLIEYNNKLENIYSVFKVKDLAKYTKIYTVSGGMNFE
jgi:hypothetical protein